MKRSLFVIFGIIFLLKTLESFVVYGHVDAINYHIVIAKYLSNGLWTEAWTTIPGSLMSGFFEFLYVIPHYIFDYGLKAHVSSQFLHYFFSLGIGSILVFNSIKNKDKVYAALAGISLLTIAKGSSFFLYAKNDGPLALSILLLYIFFERVRVKDSLSKKELITLGFLLGLAPAIKGSGILYIIPIALTFTYFHIKKPLQVLSVALIALLTWSPILFRNYYYIGNPLFPGLIEQIPGSASQAMIDYYSHHMSSKPTFISIMMNIKSLFLGKVVFLLSLVCFVKNIIDKRNDSNKVMYFLLSSFVIMMLLNGGVTAVRFLFPAYFVLVYYIFSNISKVLPKKSYVPIILLILCLVDSKIDKSFSRIKKMTKNYINLSEDEVIKKVIPLTAFWNHIDPSSKSLLYSDNLSQQYYAPLNMRVIQYQHNPAAYFTKSCSSDENLEEFKMFKYALIRADIDNPCYSLILNSQKLSTINEYSLYKLR